VEIVVPGLSKAEGLTIERPLVRVYRGQAELWTMKDDALVWRHNETA
jgi:hypothetical protein